MIFPPDNYDWPPYLRREVKLCKEHMSLGISGIIEPGPNPTKLYNSPDFLFVPKYLIIMTSGFFIENLIFKNENILSCVDGDLYYRANWYRLERMGELDLVRIKRVEMTPADRWTLFLRHRGTKPAEFRAAFVGEAIWKEYNIAQ